MIVLNLQRKRNDLGKLFVLQHLHEKKENGEVNESARQVALADVLIINKLDLVTSDELKELESQIRWVAFSTKFAVLWFFGIFKMRDCFHL